MIQNKDIDSEDKILPMVRPHFDVDRTLLEIFEESLATGCVTNNSPQVRAFERELATYLNVSDVVVVSNGADALYLGLKALDVKGKAVLPSYTFMATLNSVIAAGLEPIFCDIEPDTFTLSPTALQQLLDNDAEISCVLPVNVFGVHPNMQIISRVCRNSWVEIIYDNCHGFGSTLNNQHIASEPKLQMLSFHATKVMPAIEGGAIVSKDIDVLKKVRRLKNHGIDNKNMALVN